MQIGRWQLPNNLVLAPMAGVTDRPFRLLCRQLGAGMAVSEMITSRPELRSSRKTQLRMDHHGEPEPRSVQIAGWDPDMMAEAAQWSVKNGADIIDINMGCPAKKVCKRDAGSALLANENQVQKILSAVVHAVPNNPVTLKIRTGTTPEERNGVMIAQIAEQAGIAALAVHGRTRACAFKGPVEYQTIAHIKQSVQIPVLANGDINTPQIAEQVLQSTGADGLMLGRPAQGNPWLFKEIHHYLTAGTLLAPPTAEQRFTVMQGHLQNLYEFYGEIAGVRIARKHIGWYLKAQANYSLWKTQLMQAETANHQLQVLEQCFSAREYTEAA